MSSLDTLLVEAGYVKYDYLEQAKWKMSHLMLLTPNDVLCVLGSLLLPQAVAYHSHRSNARKIKLQPHNFVSLTENTAKFPVRSAKDETN